MRNFENRGKINSENLAQPGIQKKTHKQLMAKQLRFSVPGTGTWRKGPDFKDAELSFDGNVISGDIEIHFDEKDWQKHGITKIRMKR